MTAHLPFRDTTLSVDDRIADLLSRLTLDEKAGQLSQYFYPDTREPGSIERLITTGRAGSVLFVRDAATMNRLQRLAVEQSRLGVPLLFGFDVIHGLRTVLPVPIALAASWSPQLIEAAQTVAAREARAVGIHWTFAPMVDIARDPRWGRITEGAGEDPFLGAAVSAAQVRGFQGDLGRDRLLAGVKHFAAYGAARGGRDYDEVDVSDSELWNVYLPPFRAAVEAGVGSVMSAYMELNGVPAAGNRWLLTDVLRDELGFDGFVVSDANAVRSLETQHFARDLADAAVRALSAGLDMEMTSLDAAFANLPQAVADGRVAEEHLDAAVRRILRAKFRLGLFESPFVDEGAATSVLAAPHHRDVARRAAEQSIVLLRNADGALPLVEGSLRTVAVVGQLADSSRDLLGPWVFDHDVDETVTILGGLRRRLGDRVEVGFAPGAGIPERMFPSQFDRIDPTVAVTPAGYDDDAEIERAVALAAGADVAIVVVGQRQNQAGEKASTSTLDLPGRQLEQLQRIVATGTRVVVVMVSGRPLDLRWADGHVAAIVQAWYPGSSGGDAVAAVLLGDVSPAARLPFSWPRHVGQVPMAYSHYRTFEPQEQHARYFEEESTPLYPFGHGLSYATFEYSELRLDRATIPVGASTFVSVDVRNVSDRAADEVVQLYVHQRHGTSARPIRELKGFERVRLDAGEKRRLRFALGAEQLRYWSAARREYVQDATSVDVWVGADSTAGLVTTLEIAPAT